MVEPYNKSRSDEDGGIEGVVKVKMASDCRIFASEKEKKEKKSKAPSGRDGDYMESPWRTKMMRKTVTDWVSLHDDHISILVLPTSDYLSSHGFPSAPPTTRLFQ